MKQSTATPLVSSESKNAVAGKKSAPPKKSKTTIHTQPLVIPAESKSLPHSQDNLEAKTAAHKDGPKWDSLSSDSGDAKPAKVSNEVIKKDEEEDEFSKFLTIHHSIKKDRKSSVADNLLSTGSKQNITNTVSGGSFPNLFR